MNRPELKVTVKFKLISAGVEDGNKALTYLKVMSFVKKNGNKNGEHK
jgi:hypothetical protein